MTPSFRAAAVQRRAAGVFEYYDAQPPGMTVQYRILESRRLGADVALGYLAADFAFRDRDTVHLNIGVVVIRTSKDWHIASYQASPATRG